MPNYFQNALTKADLEDNIKDFKSRNQQKEKALKAVKEHFRAEMSKLTKVVSEKELQLQEIIQGSDRQVEVDLETNVSDDSVSGNAAPRNALEGDSVNIEGTDKLEGLQEGDNVIEDIGNSNENMQELKSFRGSNTKKLPKS